MKQYIVKHNRSISTGKGVIGEPLDPKNPTENEIITVKHFGGSNKGLTEDIAQDKLDLVLSSPKCPLEEFNPGAKTENLGIETDDNTDDAHKKLRQQSIESDKQKETESKPGENKGAQKK